MTINFIKQVSCYVPRAFLKATLLNIIKEFKIYKIKIPKEKKTISVVFMSSVKMKALNVKYRKKKTTTDILSFPSSFGESFGDLVFDYNLVKKQALQNGHSQKEELLYLLIHGLLHLLGFEHEKSKKKAKKMYKIQDSIFEKLRNLNP